MTATGKTDDIWASYWRSGQATCCKGARESEYVEALTGAWLRFLECMDNSDRVLDLCIGNGVVLLLAARYAESRGLEVDLHGVDNADIDPARNNPALLECSPNVDFLGSTPITDLPFPADSFDIVTSQFGIEYTPVGPAAAELVRVMKDGARAQFIIHAEEGVTAEAGNREIGEIDELPAARSSAECDALAALFSELGCTMTTTRPVHDHYRDHLLGWQINLRN